MCIYYDLGAWVGVPMLAWSYDMNGTYTTRNECRCMWGWKIGMIEFLATTSWHFA
jgi:hypothetical protein